jgi:hypothetical protein
MLNRLSAPSIGARCGARVPRAALMKNPRSRRTTVSARAMMGGMSPEMIEKAMKDPVMQERMKEAMKDPEVSQPAWRGRMGTRTGAPRTPCDSTRQWHARLAWVHAWVNWEIIGESGEQWWALMGRSGCLHARTECGWHWCSVPASVPAC